MYSILIRPKLRTRLLAGLLVPAIAACQSGAPSEAPGSAGESGSNGTSPSAASAMGAYEDGDTVTFVVPFGAGGGYDTYARALQPCLEETLSEVSGADVTVVVENVEGAGGQVGQERVARGPTDGTEFIINNSDETVGQQVIGGAAFDVLEMTTLGQLTALDRALLVAPHMDVSADDDPLERLVAASQEEPILLGGSSGGVSGKLLMELLAEGGFAIQYETVSFDSTPDAVAAMLREELDTLVGSTVTFLPIIEANPELELLFGLGSKNDQAPDMPTLGELGVPNADRIRITAGESVRVFWGPPDMEPGPATALTQAIEQTLSDSECSTQLADAGNPINYLEPNAVKGNLEELVATFTEYREALAE